MPTWRQKRLCVWATIPQAKAVLLRGLQLEPDSDELHYLSRILVRRGILKPDEIGAF